MRECPVSKDDVKALIPYAVLGYGSMAVILSAVSAGEWFASIIGWTGLLLAYRRFLIITRS